MLADSFTCYLIDDDQEEFEIFKMALAELDFKVECVYFKAPSLAVAHFQDGQKPAPKYIFLDLNIPAVTIADEIRILLKTFPMPHSKITVYSSYFPAALLASMINSEQVLYFQKLPTIGLLSQKMNALFTA